LERAAAHVDLALDLGLAAADARRDLLEEDPPIVEADRAHEVAHGHGDVAREEGDVLERHHAVDDRLVGGATEAHAEDDASVAPLAARRNGAERVHVDLAVDAEVERALGSLPGEFEARAGAPEARAPDDRTSLLDVDAHGADVAELHLAERGTHAIERERPAQARSVGEPATRPLDASGDRRLADRTIFADGEEGREVELARDELAAEGRALVPAERDVGDERVAEGAAADEPR